MQIFSNVWSIMKKWKLTISSIGVVALIMFSGFMLLESTKAEVEISDNGEKQTVATHADTVGELLDEEGMEVDSHDLLEPEKTASIKNGMEITYQTADEVNVLIDDAEDTYFTTADTVGEFLDEKSISTAKHDDISMKMDDEIEDGMELAIDKAFKVTIKDGDDKEKVWTTGATIEQLLDDNNITLEDADKVKPALDKKAKAGNTINITRVAKETDKVKEAIAFDTEKKEDSTLEKGKEKVISEGEEGRLIKEFEVTKENGEVVNRELVDETIDEESENRVVAIGTKEPDADSDSGDLQTLASEKEKKSSESSNANKSSGTDNSGSGKNDEPDGKVMHMTATGYTANCNGCSGVTSTGIDLNNNPHAKVVAVDPNVIPLGTKVWVEGYGEAIAGDVGGAIKGNRIDIHEPNDAAAHKWHWKEVKVKILD